MKVLVIVDVQNDFCPGGSLAVDGGDQIVGKVNELAHSGEFDLVVASQDFHPADHVSFAENHSGGELFQEVELSDGTKQILWPTHCVQGTQGVELHAELDTEKIDVIVQKGLDSNVDSYSAFFDNNRSAETGLREIIERAARDKGVHSSRDIEIAVCGLALDVCVAYTARDAADLGYNTSVVLDASRGVNQELEAEQALIRGLAADGIKCVQGSDLVRDREISRDIEGDRENGVALNP